MKCQKESWNKFLGYLEETAKKLAPRIAEEITKKTPKTKAKTPTKPQRRFFSDWNG